MAIFLDFNKIEQTLIVNSFYKSRVLAFFTMFF